MNPKSPLLFSLVLMTLAWNNWSEASPAFRLPREVAMAMSNNKGSLDDAARIEKTEINSEKSKERSAMKSSETPLSAGINSVKADAPIPEPAARAPAPALPAPPSPAAPPAAVDPPAAQPAAPVPPAAAIPPTPHEPTAQEEEAPNSSVQCPCLPGQGEQEEEIMDSEQTDDLGIPKPKPNPAEVQEEEDSSSDSSDSDSSDSETQEEEFEYSYFDSDESDERKRSLKNSLKGKHQETLSIFYAQA